MKRVFLLLCLLFVPAFAQQRATVYDLGPQVFSTHAISKGYPWRAWGYVYTRGTYAGRDACTLDEGLRPVGVWVIHGTTGNPALYSGLYRVTIGEQTFYFGGEIRALDDDGFPVSHLFDSVKGLGENGSAEVTPRAAGCFGGELRVYPGG